MRHFHSQLPLGNDHAICAHLFQCTLLKIVRRLANDHGHVQCLEVQGDENAGGQIAAHRHHSAVHVAHAQRGKHLFIPCIAHHRIGHAVGELLHLLGILVDDHDLVAQLLELQGQRRAEPSQSNNNV